MSDRIQTEVPREIGSLLGRLRGRIRRYVFLEGTALVLVLLGVLFWVSLGLDYAYFKASNLELPKWFRATFDVLVICLFTFSFVVWVGLRLLRGLRRKALALILERRFPELDDRLITAVELAESTTGHESDLTASMLKRTLDDVTRASQNLALTDVFEKRPLRRAVVLATILIASIGGFAWANQAAVQRWKAGYLDLQNEYWKRDYGLTVKVIAEPGDVVKQFKDHDYKHPRGGNLALLLETVDGKKVPELVQLHYRFTDGRGSGKATCTRDGDRGFKHSIGGLSDSLQFWVTGGDYTNRRPYTVTVVDPPRIEKIVLDCRYPEYTGMKAIDDVASDDKRDPVVVQGTQVSLPAETDFLLRGTANKPLVRVRIQFDPYELTFGAAAGSIDATAAMQATLTLKSGEGQLQQTKSIPADVVQEFFSADRLSFTVPFVMSNEATENSRKRIAQLDTAFGEPLVMRPDSPIRIYLEDTDDIVGTEPARLTINGIVDEPPIVETELRGIGSAVTRKANIPIAGLLSDDYGIANARFDFTVDGGDDWQARSFENPPGDSPRDFRLRMSETREFERFEVLPLDLTIGQKLTVTVFAQDADDLNGPHFTRGERYSFKIVSNEELLSLLYQKELNLRRRFEQILVEVKDSQADLIRHRTRVEERKQLEQEKPAADQEEAHSAKIDKLNVSVAASAERALHSLRKNANETSEIEVSFQDIREEMVNNAVATPQMLERIDEQIVGRLRAINNKDYPKIDEALGAFRHNNEKKTDPTRSIDDSIDAMTLLIRHMEEILLEMKKLETFQEALELLKAIISEQEKLADKVKAEQKKKLIKDLQLDK